MKRLSGILCTAALLCLPTASPAQGTAAAPAPPAGRDIAGPGNRSGAEAARPFARRAPAFTAEQASRGKAAYDMNCAK